MDGAKPLIGAPCPRCGRGVLFRKLAEDRVGEHVYVVSCDQGRCGREFGEEWVVRHHATEPGFWRRVART